MVVVVVAAGHGGGCVVFRCSGGTGDGHRDRDVGGYGSNNRSWYIQYIQYWWYRMW